MSSIFKFKTDVHKGLIHAGLDTIQDFLCNLGMKPHINLVEISIFSTRCLGMCFQAQLAQKILNGI